MFPTGGLGLMSPVSTLYNKSQNGFIYSDSGRTVYETEFNIGDTAYIRFSFVPLTTYGVSGGLQKIYLYDSDWTLIDTIYTSITSSVYTGGSSYNVDAEYDTSSLSAGTYILEMESDNGTNILYQYNQFDVIGPPVISGATIAPSSITQAQSVTIEWDATDMTSTDLSYVEFSNGVIRKGSSTDYISYTLTVSGEDLSVVTDGLVTIVAINERGIGTDTSLTLTVTAVVATEDFQKEEIVLPDAVDLVRQLLIDDERNHLLKHIVTHAKIITNYEGTWPELPAIYIRETEMIPMMREEPMPGGIGSKWRSVIQIDLITSDDSFCYYPPPEAGELNTGDERFNGAEKVLNVLKWIVERIMAENIRYESDTITDFQWDDNEFVNAPLIPGGYDGQKDIWAISMTYNIDLEVVSRDG